MRGVEVVCSHRQRQPPPKQTAEKRRPNNLLRLLCQSLVHHTSSSWVPEPVVACDRFSTIESAVMVDLKGKTLYEALGVDKDASQARL